MSSWCGYSKSQEEETLNSLIKLDVVALLVTDPDNSFLHYAKPGQDLKGDKAVIAWIFPQRIILETYFVELLRFLGHV